MKIRHYLYIALVMLLSGCTEELSQQPLPSGQSSLIGKGVNFDASIADRFATRTTWRHDGSFNEGDIMTIYRQYSHDAGLSFDQTTEAYRVYELVTKYATGTSIALETDWKPKAGWLGSNTPGTTFVQTDADSLTWENGNTVRFRSWSRSNLGGCLRTDKSRYYPDYCVSEWVTVSGPTLDIPMTLKHQGCRIGFRTKNGNELNKAEICTEAADYMRDDNADTQASDDADKWEDAEAKAAAVSAVYDKMCMPSGVDIKTSLLTAMTKDLYDNPATNFLELHTKTTDEGIVKLGTKTPDDIKNDVQRSQFSYNLDTYLYMVTIPYDMSDAATSGEALMLPPYTRFRIYLRDVNNGDKANTTGYEATYHIFSLSDIKKKVGDTYETMFPDGLELSPGVSYLFDVGYHYDNFTITPADDFSWEAQDAQMSEQPDAMVDMPTSEQPYQWWKNALATACEAAVTGNYEPVFHITNEAEFLEFIKLVNGTAAEERKLGDETDFELTQVVVSNPNDQDHPVYAWYRSTDVANGAPLPGREPVTKEEAEAHGFIFYQHYYPARGDRAAYSVEDYLKTPYSFFDEDLNRRFYVYLDADLDLKDWKLSPIGNEDPSVRLSDTESNPHPFRGIFDGQMHLIKDIYMDPEAGSYMFGHCFDVAIRNMRIETVHAFNLVNTAEPADTRSGYGAYIVGISIKAGSSVNPIAKDLQGGSYVVGCIYQGKASGAMVGKASSLNMFGNMMAAEGVTGGALLGEYADPNKKFFAPQTNKKLNWGNFMANYYDKTLSPSATAVGGIADAYQAQQYIRGAKSHVLKAKNDNLLSSDVDYETLPTYLKEGYYGLAPWKALNYAIWKYNSANVAVHHDVEAHFEVDDTGYAHAFPRLVSVKPTAEEVKNWNLLDQNN